MHNFYKILLLFLVVVLNSCGTSKSLHHLPDLQSYNQEVPIVQKVNDSLFTYKDNFLSKNDVGLWELYVSGDAYQRGLITGSLSQHLVQKQERVFFSKVEEIVPSKFKQSLLRQFLKWYNRKLYLHVPNEFQAEIYGISQYTSDHYNFIAPKFLRNLYLHGAHDIGHAMQDLALVGCSSMAVWGNKTEDGQLLLGRNFDFYAGDEFAEDKVIVFVKPEKGIPFMSVTWGGMIGVVSGMNLEGLTITINAGKSEIPLVAKTPISILAREILQYASTIDEAVAIAKKREVFVSESIMIGSAKDKKAALIEVSPEKFGVYEVSNTTELICSNHFQSEPYLSDERNLEQIAESHSQYRFERMEELLEEKDKMNPVKMVEILRNREGLNDLRIGYGNEKALNQLLAHHGIVFKPEEKLVWVSSNPYQLGEFVAYDLNAVFNSDKLRKNYSLAIENKSIPEDNFVHSQAYENYEKYRVLDREIDEALENQKSLNLDFIKEYQNANPDNWIVYYKIGKYYYSKGYFKAAEIEFLKAKTKEITTVPDKENIDQYLKKISKKIN